MAAPTLSIIVPVYKVEAYLETCIDSILAQTFRDFELLLVDDGSPDGCPALCDQAAEKDPHVKVIHQKNGGLSAARNAGLDIARGQWIGFVDSDDFIAPEMYEQLYRRVQQDHTKLALCEYRLVTEAGAPLPSRSAITEDTVLNREEAMARIDGGHFTVAWNRLYHRSLFDELRFPVGRLREDEFTVHRIYWQCERISVIAQPLYFYVQRAGSIMQTPSIKSKLDLIDAFFDRADFEWENGLRKAACSYYKNVMWRFAEVQEWELTAEQQQWERGMRRKLNDRARRMLRGGCSPAEKVKLWLFLLSPEAYRKAQILKTRLKG